jgi:hypothetical protein
MTTYPNFENLKEATLVNLRYLYSLVKTVNIKGKKLLKVMFLKQSKREALVYGICGSEILSNETPRKGNM